MADLSRDDLIAIQGALKSVLTDREVLAPLIDPLITKIVLDKMTDKFERTLGVNCQDPEAREETRKDMEALRKARLYAETEEGQANIAALRKLMRVINSTATSIVKGLVWTAVAGFLTLLAIGAASNSSIRRFFN